MRAADRCAELARVIDQLRIRIGMPHEIFEAAVRPVIDACREVSGACAGAPGCQPDAQPCPLLQRLTVAGIALDYRRGRILPPHAAPEDIGERAPRWTYAVFVAALILADGASQGNSVSTAVTPGVPGTDGEVVQAVALPSARRDRLTWDALSLFRRIVPPAIQVWLARDQRLHDELQALLSGDRTAKGGAIGLLVTRAVAALAGADTAAPVVGDTHIRRIAAAQTPPVAPTLRATAATSRDPVGPAGSAGARDAAQRFMHWVSSGISDGSLRVNQADAMVHFVPEGMLLVSPRIFQGFARQFGEDGAGVASSAPADDPRLGLGIQRQVLRAGWHRLAANGINMHRFEVLRHGKPVSTLSGVLIPHPECFVGDLPPCNPSLGRRVSS